MNKYKKLRCLYVIQYKYNEIQQNILKLYVIQYKYNEIQQNILNKTNLLTNSLYRCYTSNFNCSGRNGIHDTMHSPRIPACCMDCKYSMVGI